MSFSRFLLISASLSCLYAAAALAADPAPIPAMPAPAANANAPVTRQELPALIKETILNDPDIIMQAVQKLREKQATQAKEQAQAGIKKHYNELFNDAASPSLGDAKAADVTIVEFFDYHCGYCKHFLPTLVQLTKEDKKVRVVFKEFPILSEDSVLASRAALAVNRVAKDKYFDYHTALMKHNGKFDQKTLLDIAKKQGINADKVKTEMDSKEVSAMLDKNREIASELGITGTPAVIIGNEVSPGAMPYEELKKMVTDARAKKSEGASATPPAAPAAAAPAPTPVPPPAAVPAPATEPKP